MKASELRGQSPEVLRAMLLERRKEQFRQRIQKATGQLEANQLIRQTRRDIARIKTVLQQLNDRTDR
jgi:large subunit ribosomal protein L29